jgi:hypothetical protein
MENFTKEQITEAFDMSVMSRKTLEIVDMLANKTNGSVLLGHLKSCDDGVIFGLMKLFNIDESLKTKPKSRGIAIEESLVKYYKKG